MAWGSAAQKAAVSKAAAADHALHGAGHLTAAQLAASRNNLSKARAKRAKTRHKATLKNRKRPHSLGHGPMGFHSLGFKQKIKFNYKRPTGRQAKFHSEISPGGYNRRTAWRKANKHTFRKVLHKRKPKQIRISHWSGNRKRIRPR